MVFKIHKNSDIPLYCYVDVCEWLKLVDMWDRLKSCKK